MLKLSHLSDLSQLRQPQSLTAAYSQDEVIKAANLTKSYHPEVPVLTGIDLSIKCGERVALIGPNGSGKSTLLKCLIGLQPNTAGELTTLSHQFTRMPNRAQQKNIRKQIGFVFQHHCLVRRQSALSNVVHGMLGHTGSWRAFHHMTAPDIWRKDAIHALEQVNLADVASQRCDRLSGGQQQRVAIARALISKPKLLVADEPAASLDPAAGHDVMSLFSSQCQQQNITLLFTSHDMAHATSYADRIIALKHGRITLDLPTAQVGDNALNEVFA